MSGPTTMPDRLLLTVEDAAVQLSVSSRTVWRLIGLGELETVRIGKSVRVTRASLERFVAKGGRQ
jgi:excisionase family DNA binding protein